MTAKAFVDTNVLLYALTPNLPWHSLSESILAERPALSVQVLNECADVLRRKVRWSWEEIEESLGGIVRLCGPPMELTYAIHQSAVEIARRYNYRIYDALILAAALAAGCGTLYSEDMQNGQKIRDLTIRNPFPSH